MGRFNLLDYLAALGIVAIAVVTAAAIEGYANYKANSALDVQQMFLMAEIKRQCDSPFPLLLDNSLYRCTYLHELVATDKKSGSQKPAAHPASEPSR